MTVSSETAAQQPREVSRTGSGELPGEPSNDTAAGPSTSEGRNTPGNEGAADDGPAPVIAGDVSAELAGLANRPVEEHPDVYEAISRRLGDTLSGIDHV